VAILSRAVRAVRGTRRGAARRRGAVRGAARSFLRVRRGVLRLHFHSGWQDGVFLRFRTAAVHRGIRSIRRIPRAARGVPRGVRLSRYICFLCLASLNIWVKALNCLE